MNKEIRESVLFASWTVHRESKERHLPVILCVKLLLLLLLCQSVYTCHSAAAAALSLFSDINIDQ